MSDYLTGQRRDAAFRCRCPSDGYQLVYHKPLQRRCVLCGSVFAYYTDDDFSPGHVNIVDRIQWWRKANA